MQKKIVRIVDITKNDKGEEVLSVMIDGSTEFDPVLVPAVELQKKLMSRDDFNLLYRKFKKNRPWFRNNVEFVS